MSGEWHSKCLDELADIHQEKVNPADQIDQIFHHFSIPAFDAGQQPVVEPGSSIGSQKFTVPPISVLVSRLNPRIPRVWAPNIAEDVSALASTEFLVLIPRAGVDRKFLKYACLSPSVHTELKLRATGTSGSHQRVRPDDALSIVVDVPSSVSEQRAIAHILGTLDDKIELNRRMNETLEATARAIFKDWFVDFGPTRAKMEDRAPYLPLEIWDLFPDTLDDEGKPEGWGMGVLDEVASAPRRSVNPAHVAEDTPYIGLEHMPRRSVALTEWEEAKKVTSNKSIFKKGEFLFGKLRPYFHKVGIAPLNGICSTDIVVVAPREPHWTAFALVCLSSNTFVAHTSQSSTGTKMPRTSWKTMRQYRLCLPSDQTAQAFQRLVQSIFDRLTNNVHENLTLAQIRDLVLPSLVSGRISLYDKNISESTRKLNSSKRPSRKGYRIGFYQNEK